MKSILLTDWVTIRGTNTSTTVTQEQSQWLDLTPYGSVFFWVDCRGFTGTVQLTIDTGTCLDEAFFAPIVGPITLAVSQSPVLLFAGVPGASFLARYVRWRLTGAGSPWDATFRVWAGAVVPGM